jgi:hypothetical protein
MAAPTRVLAFAMLITAGTAHAQNATGTWLN